MILKKIQKLYTHDFAFFFFGVPPASGGLLVIFPAVGLVGLRSSYSSVPLDEEDSSSGIAPVNVSPTAAIGGGYWAPPVMDRLAGLVAVKIKMEGNGKNK